MSLYHTPQPKYEVETKEKNPGWSLFYHSVLRDGGLFFLTPCNFYPRVWQATVGFVCATTKIEGKSVALQQQAWLIIAPYP